MKKYLILFLAMAGLARAVDPRLESTDVSNSWDRTLTGIPVISNQYIHGTNTLWATNSLGTASALRTVLLSSNGLLHPSMLPVGSQITTNLNGYTYTSSGGYDWSTIFTLTTTASNGLVCVSGEAIIGPSQPQTVWFRVRDTANTVGDHDAKTAISGANGTPYHAMIYDLLTGTPKTYVVEVATSSTSATFTNVLGGSAGSFVAMSNGLNMKVIQFQPIPQ